MTDNQTTKLKRCIKCIDDMTDDLLEIADALEEHQINVKLDNGRYLNPVSAIRSKVDVIWDETQAIAATLGRPKARAHPYGYEPDTGAFDVTRCECGCINDISAMYCNDCGGEIEVDMDAEKEVYHCPRHLVFAEKHDDGSLEFGGKRYIAVTLGSDASDKLKAWFDPEHVDAQRDINGTCPIGNGTASDDAHSKAHSTKPTLSQLFGILSDEADSRTQLVADIQAWFESNVAVSVWLTDVMEQVRRWLDRQAAITRAECMGGFDGFLEARVHERTADLECKYEASSRANEILTLENAHVKTENAKLQEEVDRLKRENLNLAHDLGECMADRDRYRSKLGECADLAGEMRNVAMGFEDAALVDLEGNVV